MKTAKDWVEEFIQMIDDCEDRESRLTEWELNFMSDMREKLEVENPKPLSSKQQNCLEDIWERATARG